MNYSPTCVSVECRGIADSIICVWINQVVDGLCHRHQLRQQCECSCIASKLTQIQLHYSCLCNITLTSPTRPLLFLHWITSGFCVPHCWNRNTTERGRVVPNRICCLQHEVTYVCQEECSIFSVILCILWQDLLLLKNQQTILI